MCGVSASITRSTVSARALVHSACGIRANDRQSKWASSLTPALSADASHRLGLRVAHVKPSNFVMGAIVLTAGTSARRWGIDREIAPALAGLEALRRWSLMMCCSRSTGHRLSQDRGGNALIATSFAVLHAISNEAGLPRWRYLASDRAVRLRERFRK